MSRPRAFRDANDLWFDAGRTAAALKAYEHLVADDPEDPVALYQLSRVLWAIDRFDEAQAVAERALEQTERLSPEGRELLEEWRATAERHPRTRQPWELTPSELDMDVLATRSHVPWNDIVTAARAREMSGLVRIATEQTMGNLSDAEDFREYELAELHRERDRALLNYIGLAPIEEPLADTDALVPERAAPSLLPPTQHIQPPLPPNHRAEDIPPSVVLPTLAAELSLKAEIVPATAPAYAPLRLKLTLKNVSNRSVLVNGRLLLVPAGTPAELGEVTLQVRGPRDYANQCGFRVRSGRPQPSDFATLEPDQSLTREYPISNYESLHVPGDYQIEVTYHNSIPERIGDDIALVGSAVARAPFARE